MGSAIQRFRFYLLLSIDTTYPILNMGHVVEEHVQPRRLLTDVARSNLLLCFLLLGYYLFIFILSSPLTQRAFFRHMMLLAGLDLFILFPSNFVALGFTNVLLVLMWWCAHAEIRIGYVLAHVIACHILDVLLFL